MSEQRDVIEVLLHDHREVEEMFGQLEALKSTAATDPAARQQRREIVDKVIKELVRHSEAEEMYVYPAARDALGDPDLVDREIGEHSAAERTMSKLDGMSPEDPEFEPAVETLMRGIRQHVSEEETTLLPRLRDAVSVEELLKLGKAVETAKQVAPTHPHPGAAT